MSQNDTDSSKFLKLIATPEPPLLGPQPRPGVLALHELEAALNGFFSAHKVQPRIQPYLKSAALLWHDHLDASHTISQDLETADGSWLHGIMHRREPDFGNAKYWFRRVGQHVAFASLAEQAATILHNNTHGLTARLIENGDWDPFAYIDECERAQRSNDTARQSILRQLQAAEFNALVSHLFNPL
jgi:hypothetical protein